MHHIRKRWPYFAVLLSLVILRSCAALSSINSPIRAGQLWSSGKQEWQHRGQWICESELHVLQVFTAAFAVFVVFGERLIFLQASKTNAEVIAISGCSPSEKNELALCGFSSSC